jgi:RNA polymerase sigma factor (sigma-70 family)
VSNNFIDKNYKKWLNFSKIITNNKESEDLLHNLIIVFMEKDLPDEKMSDNYVFISLRNSFLTRVTSKKNNMIDTNLDISFELESVINTNEWDIEQMIIDDDTTQEKLDCITNTILNLNQFERKLYQLHFIYGLSQRKIAREISVSHLTINQRINKIKEKIKNNYGTI